MGSYLIDTQTLILAFLAPAKLPGKARAIMEDGRTDRILSSVSIVEVGIKSGLGKLNITEAELKMAISDLRLRLVEFSSAHAYRLFSLPERTDIFDRMLVATALELNIPVISGDREFARYKGLQVIWK